MRKIFLLLVPLIFVLSGCGTSDNEKKIGTIKYLNVTEEAFDQIYKETNPRARQTANIFFSTI